MSRKGPKGKVFTEGGVGGRVSQSSDKEWNGEEGGRRVSLLAVELLLELGPAVQLNQWAWRWLSLKSWHLEPYGSAPPISHANRSSHPFIHSFIEAEDTAMGKRKPLTLWTSVPVGRQVKNNQTSKG